MAIMLSNVIFFHMPRTGGTWLSSILKANFSHAKLGYKHMTPRELSVPIDKFKFGFIRNPVHWYISKFCAPTHNRRLWTGMDSMNNPIFQLDALDLDESFADWVRRHLRARPGWLTWYHKWFYGHNYRLVDFIGQYERRVRHLRKVLLLAGQEMPLKFKRKRRRFQRSDEERKATCLYPRRVLANLIEQEKPIFERFGYPTDVDYYAELINL